MEQIKGVYAAGLSVLDENLALDVKNTIKHAENVIDLGCHGVVFFGSTGPWFCGLSAFLQFAG